MNIQELDPHDWNSVTTAYVVKLLREMLARHDDRCAKLFLENMRCADDRCYWPRKEDL